MILYVFNQPFPENSGFGRRCQREIEALSTVDSVTVICRQSEGELAQERIKLDEHEVDVVRFSAKSEVVHRPDGYTANGFYEVKRNLDLLRNLCGTLYRVMKWAPKSQTKLYAVTSPLTVPLIGAMLGKLMGVQPEVISFHDLEPELAIHLKKLPEHHWIVKVELLLEKIASCLYRKVLVTTEGQAERLSQRTGIQRDRICAIVNTTDILSKKSVALPKEFSSFVYKDDFVLVYMSTLSFDYTVNGAISLIEYLSKRDDLQKFKLVILGNGEGLSLIEQAIFQSKMQHAVRCLGYVSEPVGILEASHAALIPWQQDIMTEVMLPTKLFEYLSIGLPVLAPRFGEFQRILHDKQNALLFSSSEELFENVKKLQAHPELRKKIGQSGKTLYSKVYQPSILNKQLLTFCTKE